MKFIPYTKTISYNFSKASKTSNSSWFPNKSGTLRYIVTSMPTSQIKCNINSQCLIIWLVHYSYHAIFSTSPYFSLTKHNKVKTYETYFLSYHFLPLSSTYSGICLSLKVTLQASTGSVPQLLLSAMTFHIQKIPAGKGPTVWKYFSYQKNKNNYT